jgi:hypothetical protein
MKRLQHSRNCFSFVSTDWPAIKSAPAARAATTAFIFSVVLGCASKPPSQASGPDPMASANAEEGSAESSGERSAPNAGSGSQSSTGISGAPVPISTTPSAGGMEGAKFGMTHTDVLRLYNEIGGVIDREYDGILRKMQPGVLMKSTEAERDSLKKSFERSLIEFKDLPTGLDSTGLRAEYTYKNRESLMSMERLGKKRIFFFLGDRLWKLYDEVKFAKDGPVGVSFQEAATKLAAQFGGPGKAAPTDPQKGNIFPTLEWQGTGTHMRAVDRTGERLIGVVIEDKTTLNNLPQLRSAKIEDPFAIDPSIAAVTKGGVSDPSGIATPTGTAGAKPAKPPKAK